MSTHVIAMQQKNKKQAKGGLSDLYRTPPWLFDWLNDVYGFDFDICASADNTKCEKFYSEENPYNGKDWSELGCIGFCNPPFSAGQKEKALAEAYRNMIDNCVSSVFVIPFDIANDFWIKDIWGKATGVISINGRVKFYDPVTNEETKHGLGIGVIEFIAGLPPQPVGLMEIIKRDDIKSRYQ